MTLLADHLWQSILFCLIAGFFACLARINHPKIRLWLWRAAALKFLFPFALLYRVGRWLGFPMPHSADPAPELLVALCDRLITVFAPVQALEPEAAWLALALMVVCSAACLRWIWNALPLEAWRARLETRREELDTDDRAPGLGFFKAAGMTATAATLAILPLLMGAISDRQHRREVLIANSRMLRTAPTVMTTAAPGMGNRMRVIADERGILIRNTSIQDLVALAYGVNHYSIWTDQMFSEDAEPEDKYWLSLPRYDVRVTASIAEPARFDAYALRQRVTKLLADRFSLEIYVEQRCQPPCGRYKVEQPADPL